MGTPFSASSTASDVLDGPDLTGEEVIVTGGHSRLGSEVSRTLTAAGATVTVAARNPQAAAAVADIPDVRVEQLDLTDPDSVEAFAQRWHSARRALHVLVNNAAAMFPPELVLDARGHELAFSTVADTGSVGGFRVLAMARGRVAATGAARSRFLHAASPCISAQLLPAAIGRLPARGLAPDTLSIDDLVGHRVARSWDGRLDTAVRVIM